MRSAKATGRASLLSGALVVFFASSAAAQGTPAASDKVAAEALFETGRKLVAEGNYGEACPKFADSQRLDPSPSTLLNLASCWEKLGRTATAWATYKEAESAANAAKRQDYVVVAQRHVETLAPKLSRLTITVAQSSTGMVLKRDGADVPPAQWGVAIPIDRGSHAIEASAPGFRDWATSVDVSQEGSQIAITVPPLEAAPAEPSPPAVAPPNAPATTPAPPPPGESTGPFGTSQRTIGFAVGAAGLVGLGVSGAFAVIANSKNQDSLKDCSSDKNLCTAAGVSLRNDALSAGDASTVAFVIGAAALATGVVLWVTSHPSEGGHGGAKGITLTAGLGGARLEGTWQ